MASQKDRRVLPPGVEDEVVFGIMWIRVGVVKAIRPSTMKHKVHVQFWGEGEPVTLEPEGSKALQQYDIKCPITIFQNYLRDMKKNFRVEVENLGIADVNLSAYLKPNVTITSQAPFNPMKGVFEVIGRTGKKVGSLQLEMSAHFSPQIALRELQEQEKKDLEGPSEKIPLSNFQTKQKPCPAEKMKGCKCSGVCKCKADKITALEVLAVEKPDIFMEFYQELKEKEIIKNVKPTVFQKDDRIPNSLRIEPTTATFDANRYLQGDPVPAKNEQVFPTVQKILTYSNLRLKKQEEVKQSPKQRKSKQELLPSNQVFPKASVQSGQTTPVNKLNQMNQFIMKEQKPSPPSKMDRKVQIVQIFQRKEPVLNTNMKIKPIIPVAQHDAKVEASISEIDKVNLLDQSDDVEAHQNILSRVVNLNQQLVKQRKRSPTKFPLKEVVQPKALQAWIKPAFVPLGSVPQLTAHQQRKRSSLLMNMVIQIPTATVKFIKNSKFVVSYLPYGQKEMIMVGPNLPASLMIMFPVGEAQISKMNKIPFILEFWTNKDRQNLLGIIKLSLTKIYKGFMMEGRLNQMAVKTSILPTVIEKGVGVITTVTDKPVGQCYLSAYIGTTAQIQTFLNSHKNQVVPQPSLQIQNESQKDKQDQKKKRQLQIREKGTIDDFTNLLALIDSFSNPSAAKQLLNFMSLKRADKVQFISFIDRLGFKGANIFHLLENGQTLECVELANSFQDYKRTKQVINAQLNTCLKGIPIIRIADYVDKIKQRSIFGVISKQGLIEVIGNQLKEVADYLGDAIETDSFAEWLRGEGRLSLKSIQLIGAESMKEVLSNIFMRECKDVVHKMDQLLKAEQGLNQVSVSKLRVYFPREGGKLFSVWFWLLLNKLICSCFDEIVQNVKVVNTSLLYNWIALRSRQLKEVAEVEDIKKQQKDIEQDMPREDKQIKKLPQRDDSPEKSHILQQSEKKEIAVKQSQIKEPSMHENPPLPEQRRKQQQQPSNILQHKFIVSIQQLHLEQDLTGQCTVFYRFPFEEDQISSRHFQLQHEKHKYRLNSQGIHKFTIAEPLHQYFGESTLKVRVVVAGEGELCGDLHSDELVVRGSQFRVVPLFSVAQEGMAGKIKLKVEYSNKKSTQLALGRQTVRDVFLPKNGFLNFQLMTSVDQVKIRQQFNIKEQFYLLLSIDPFGENIGLAPHYPPFNSKLESDLTSPLVVVGSYKIALTPQIVQHLRSGSCTARLLMVYYAKEKGNYDRKEAMIASFKTPLISVIREQGLKGDYAFKNKLGMFVSLAQCSIKYEKQARGQLELSRNHFARESFWIVIRFTEIINFQGELGWVRFQVARNGKRVSTEKALIRDEGFVTLEASCLLLQMGEEDFASTKLLPISMNTAGQHFGIDINLRPIAKSLSKSKWSVDSHYFMVVDDQSRSRKMRVGAKIYGFRGQADLGHFVQAISKNRIQTMAEFSERQDDYPQLVEGLKKQLKLSTKALEEALGLILDKRKKQKLPLSFFSSRIYPNLDLTPVIASSSSDVNLLAEEMSSEVDKLYLIENLEQLGVKLINLRPELLDRYSFSRLNQKRLDQNVEYLGLHSEIDLLVLLRKIRVEEARNNEQSFRQKLEDGPRTVRISIIRGYNFHLLYNGIKPNVRVRIPDIGLQTEVIERTSEPIFNEHISLSVPKGELRKIRIQVYHEGSQQDEGILIGEATLSIAESILSNDLPYSKIYRAVINSLMSTKMQAALDVKVELLPGSEGVPVEPRNILDQQSSIGDSRIQEVMDRVNNANIYKRDAAAFFESSEEDD